MFAMLLHVVTCCRKSPFLPRLSWWSSSNVINSMVFPECVTRCTIHAYLCNQVVKLGRFTKEVTHAEVGAEGQVLIKCTAFEKPPFSKLGG